MKKNRKERKNIFKKWLQTFFAAVRNPRYINAPVSKVISLLYHFSCPAIKSRDHKILFFLTPFLHFNVSRSYWLPVTNKIYRWSIFLIKKNPQQLNLSVSANSYQLHQPFSSGVVSVNFFSPVWMRIAILSQ